MTAPSSQAAANGTRSPALLALVFGVFLAIIGVTATAQIIIVSAQLSTTSLSSVVGSDTSLTRILVNGTLKPSDIGGPPPNAERVAAIRAQLASVVARGGMLRAEVRSPDGDILFASDDRPVTVASDPDFLRASTGTSAVSIVPARSADFDTSQLLFEALPIISNGQVQAVFVVYRDAEPILQSIESSRTLIVAVTLSAAVIVGVLLYLIFRSAQRRLTRQTQALLESTRRDPLTGSLNHGAVVAELAHQLEAARESGQTVEIALVDIDNFRLLNNTHSHADGDTVLLEIAALIRSRIPPDSTFGRYGPDEFLVVAPPNPAPILASVLERLRLDLESLSFRFDGTESLPVSVSVGICAYPLDADSVTALLSVGAMTLAEAKSSGGDAIRVANALGAKPAFTKTFDVLQGLVIAIDTKDRYTKRHSEDVARYADFIAEQLDVEPELRRAIHVSGLLHDIGKIGIPDAVLRKPAKLTAEEARAFQQHVALGEMIIRDLPNLELVRAGVRFHHERWDGQGYLERLAGTDIPMIARILAVADAFSAMTTTRPYRKALDVSEAIQRLEDAAGTQLEERIVRAFLDGLEDADERMLPQTDIWRARIWTPADNVA